MAIDSDAVRDAIKTRLETITGLRTSKYPPDQINLPQVFIGKVTEQFHDDFTDGSRLRAEIVLLAAARQNGIFHGYGLLSPYLAKTGASSIYAAIEGGAGLEVMSQDDTPIEYCGVQYIGATWVCEVLG